MCLHCTEAIAIANRLVLSPDVTKAVFDARVASGATRIFVIDLTTAVGVTKLNEYFGEPTIDDTFPTWSSNSLVAFDSDSGGTHNVYRVTVAGAGRTLIMVDATEPWYAPASR